MPVFLEIEEMIIDYEFIVNVLGLYPSQSRYKEEVGPMLEWIWNRTLELRKSGTEELDSAIQARAEWLKKYMEGAKRNDH